MADVLVELCAGSAALTRWRSGGWKLVSYAGGKDGYAESIADLMDLQRVERVLLAEPGIWHDVWVALTWGLSDRVADVVERWQYEDARTLWDALRGGRGKYEHEWVRAARALVLVSGTHGGHERGGFKGLHVNRPSVDGFIPSRGSLAWRLREIPELPPIEVFRYAADVEPFAGACVYIDPPYKGRTGYEHTLTRFEVIELAMAWKDAGARVVAVSEATPLRFDNGWTTHELTAARRGQVRRNSRSVQEWLTVYKRT